MAFNHKNPKTANSDHKDPCLCEQFSSSIGTLVTGHCVLICLENGMALCHKKQGIVSSFKSHWEKSDLAERDLLNLWCGYVKPGTGFCLNQPMLGISDPLISTLKREYMKRQTVTGTQKVTEVLNYIAFVIYCPFCPRHINSIEYKPGQKSAKQDTLE